MRSRPIAAPVAAGLIYMRQGLLFDSQFSGQSRRLQNCPPGSHTKLTRGSDVDACSKRLEQSYVGERKKRFTKRRNPSIGTTPATDQ